MLLFHWLHFCYRLLHCHFRAWLKFITVRINTEKVNNSLLTLSVLVINFIGNLNLWCLLLACMRKKIILCLCTTAEDSSILQHISRLWFCPFCKTATIQIFLGDSSLVLKEEISSSLLHFPCWRWESSFSNNTRCMKEYYVAFRGCLVFWTLYFYNKKHAKSFIFYFLIEFNFLYLQKNRH